jgi:hypothetical protein
MKKSRSIAVIKKQHCYLMKRLHFLIGEGMTLEEFKAHIAREMESNVSQKGDQS